MPIPKTILKHSKDIRTKTYGKDVREAIATGVETSGEMSEEALVTSKDTRARQSDVEFRFNDQLAGNTDIDELIDARRPFGKEAYSTLRQRLDTENEDVNLKLSQTIMLDNIKNTVSVGSDGDFDTINEALESLSYRKPQYKKQGLTDEKFVTNELFEINLLSGFIVEEQILLEGGVDLGHVVISSEDSVVSVNRTSLTQVTSFDRKPLFGAHYNSVLPIINTLFKIDNTSAISVINDMTVGIYCVGNSSVVITKGSGVQGAGIGLHLNGATAYARESNFDECFWGVRTSQGATLRGRDISAQKCAEYGIAVATGCSLDVRGSNTSYAGMRGLFVAGGSLVDFREGVSNYCKTGLWVRLGGYVIAADSEIMHNTEYGIDVEESQIMLGRATVSQNGIRDINSKGGVTLTTFQCTTTHSNEITRGDLNLIDTNVKKINVVDTDTNTLIIGRSYEGTESRTVSGQRTITIGAGEERSFAIRYPEGEQFWEAPICTMSPVTSSKQISVRLTEVKDFEFIVNITNSSDTSRNVGINYIASSKTIPYGRQV